MEFKTKFNVDDVVYFYSNEYKKYFGFESKMVSGPQAIFIQQGQIWEINVVHSGLNFITYKVRIGSSITVEVHENYLAKSVDELAEQSKKYALSPVSKTSKK
jgi:hypothetical protein